MTIRSTASTSIRLFRLMATALVLAIAGCGGGGGGGTGPGSSCTGTTVYNSYGYSDDPNGEIDVAMKLPLASNITQGCALPHALTGILPAGLTFNSSNGTISGTPTQAGIFPVTVRPQGTGDTVFANLTIRVDPVGPITPLVTATRVATVSGLPAFGTNLVAVNHGAGTVLYTSGIGNALNKELWRSLDGGATWAITNFANQPTASTELYFGGNGKLYMLDIGAFGTAESFLHSFDGSNWIVATVPLPFSMVGMVNAAAHVQSNGNLLLTWFDRFQSFLWSSQDGQTWVDNGGIGISIPFIGNNSGASICIASAGTDLRAFTDINAVFGMSVRSTGLTSWSQESWPNSVPWPTTGFTPAALCASMQGRYWLFGTGADATSGTYVRATAIDQGETALKFPRRLRNLPGLDVVTSDGNTIYGLRFFSGSHEVWRLQ